VSKTTVQPAIVERAAQPYVAFRETATMQTMDQPARRFPVLFGWLGAQGIAPAGAPFYKYDVIDMARELIVEAGVPVASEPEVPAEMVAGVLPGGRYVSVTHVGHPDQLVDVVRAMLVWADEQGLTWDKTDTPDGEAWGCRLEIYETNPQEEPDMNKWETELAFRLAD
jgi:predicted transcriptional regulator YdeE